MMQNAQQRWTRRRPVRQGPPKHSWTRLGMWGPLPQVYMHFRAVKMRSQADRTHVKQEHKFGKLWSPASTLILLSVFVLHWCTAQSSFLEMRSISWSKCSFPSVCLLRSCKLLLKNNDLKSANYESARGTHRSQVDSVSGSRKDWMTVSYYYYFGSMVAIWLLDH